MRGNPRGSRTYAGALMITVAAVTAVAGCTGSTTRPPATVSPAGSHSAAGSTAAKSQSAAPLSPQPTGPTVAPPVPGTINQTVAAGHARLLPTVAITAPVHYRRVELAAAIGQVARVSAKGHIPGELSGAAVSVLLDLRDVGHRPISLTSTITVTVQDAAGTPFVPLPTSTHAVTGTLAAGQRTQGTYVFHLPSGYRNPVTIEVTYAATAEVARFVGAVS